MSVELRRVLAGVQFTEPGGGLTYTGAEALNRINEAIAELQVLTAPNGSRWVIGVDNAGNLTTTSV